MSGDNKSEASPGKEGGGLFHRLFGHHTPGPDSHSVVATKSSLDLDDIQGFILRGYRMPMVRHFLLTVGVPAEARKVLGRLVSGDEANAPQITTAEDWHVGFEPGPNDNRAEPPHRKPDYCLNLGITWPGMVALELKDRVPLLSFKSFDAFIAGAAQRANLVHDTGASAPQNWIGGFGKGSDHVLVTLHAISPDAMTTYSNQLATLFAEQKLNRRWIGIDITHLAIGLIKTRLDDSFGHEVRKTYEVIGEPTDVAGAAQLADENKFQFQAWALGLCGARPAEGVKKGADRGIDGRLYFHDDRSGDSKQIIFSVKGGHNIHVSEVRDLIGVLQREKAEIGVYISFEEPTKPMQKEAAEAGFYTSQDGSRYPRLQLLTVEDLLEGNKTVQRPLHVREVTFKKAPRSRPDVAQNLKLNLSETE